jgi:hypothetical protein
MDKKLADRGSPVPRCPPSFALRLRRTSQKPPISLEGNAEDSVSSLREIL